MIEGFAALALAPPGTSFIDKSGKLHRTGGLGWSPETFWRATLTEFHLAMKERHATETTDITAADARSIARTRGYAIWGEE